MHRLSRTIFAMLLNHLVRRLMNLIKIGLDPANQNN